jgi:hypothetical protein
MKADPSGLGSMNQAAPSRKDSQGQIAARTRPFLLRGKSPDGEHLLVARILLDHPPVPDLNGIGEVKTQTRRHPAGEFRLSLNQMLKRRMERGILAGRDDTEARLELSGRSALVDDKADTVP